MKGLRFNGRVRLVQAAYHNRSLSLYTKLAFVVRRKILTGPLVTDANMNGDCSGKVMLQSKPRTSSKKRRLASTFEKARLVVSFVQDSFARFIRNTFRMLAGRITLSEVKRQSTNVTKP
jgi:hypothetical protein